MADNQKIQSSGVIQDRLFQPTIDSGIALLQVLSQLEKQLADIAAVTKTSFKSVTPTDYEGIKALNENAKLANDIFNQRQKILEQTRVAEAKLTESISQESQELSRLRLEIERVNKENKEQAKAASITTGEYEKAAIRLNQVRKAWKDLAIVQKDNTAEAKALKKELDQLDASLKKVDAAAGQHQRSVGNYASGFNGLQNSINQITRELPSFTNSIQTGLMGISNNLPILADNIANIRKQNADLLAQGIKAPSVFKQLTGSLLSWNTAMSVGITLLTIYGPKIAEMFAEMVSGSDTFDEYAFKQKTINEVTKQATESTAAEISSLQQLLSVAKNENASKKERLEAIRQLNEINPYYQNSLTLEKINTEFATKATDEYIKALNRKATAEALAAKRTELIKAQADALLRPLEENITTLNKAKLAFQSTYTSDANLLKKTVKAGIEDRNRAIESINQQIDALDELEKQMFATNNASVTDPDEEAKRIADEKKKAEELRKKRLEEQKKLREEQAKADAKWEKEKLQFERELEEARINNIKNDVQREIELIKFKTRVAMENNRLEYGDNKTTNDLNHELYLKQEADIKKLTDLKAKADKIELISQDELAKAGQKADEYRQKQAEKREKEAIKRRERLQKESFDMLGKAMSNFTDTSIRNVDREISAAKQRQEDLRAAAIAGNQDAQNSLALARREEQRLQSEREKRIKAQKRAEITLALIKTYVAELDKSKDPAQALKSSAGAVAGIAGAVGTLPEFFHGTEDTGPGGNVDSKRGFAAVLHPHERVMTREQNKKVGDRTNEEVADVMEAYNLGKLLNPTAFDKMPVLMPDSSFSIGIEQMTKKLESIENTIKNRPVQRTEFDTVEKLITHRLTTNNKTQITKYKPDHYG